MRVDIEKVLAMQEERAKINRRFLDSIEWYESGVKVDIPKKMIAEFEYMGLSNMDFITTGFYKGPRKG